MPVGVGALRYPDQDPAPELRNGDVYFRVRLHEGQAFFPGSPLGGAAYLVVNSSVSSSMQAQPGQPLQGIQQVNALKRNTPQRIGRSIDLTDWLPAQIDGSVRVNLSYIVTQEELLRRLSSQLAALNLAPKVSLVSQKAAAAIKVAEIAGKLLSYLLPEGTRTEAFSLAADFDVANLRAGYYVALGSVSNVTWPEALAIDKNGRLIDGQGHELHHHSYAVFQVQVMPRRGEEAARGEAWWELLQFALQQTLQTLVISADDRRQTLYDWRRALAYVVELARRDRAFLRNEVQDMLRQAQVQVEEHLAPPFIPQGYGDDNYPPAWQELLDAQNFAHVKQLVRQYEHALQVSQQQRALYGEAD